MFEDILIERNCKTCQFYIPSTHLGHGVYTYDTCHKRGILPSPQYEGCDYWEEKCLKIY